MGNAYKMVPRTAKLENAISDGFSELQSLAEECREIVDNAPEGLNQTDRIQTLEATADALDDTQSEPDVPKFLADIEVKWFDSQRARRGASPSRSTRCSNAVAALQAAQDVVSQRLEIMEQEEEQRESEAYDQVQELHERLQEVIDAAEGCEFPGMFG